MKKLYPYPLGEDEPYGYAQHCYFLGEVEQQWWYYISGQDRCFVTGIIGDRRRVSLYPDLPEEIYINFVQLKLEGVIAE